MQSKIIFLMKASSRSVERIKKKVKVTRGGGAATASCLKRILFNAFSSVAYSPSPPIINIQSILHTAPNLYNSISLTVLLGGNSNSLIVSVQ